MSRKILHAADVHLDSPLQKLGGYEGAPVDLVRGASRRALANMVQLALDEEVDLVVIAGDLYDGDWRDQNTGLYFVSQASKLVNAGIPLVVIRGNHDAANNMTSSLPLPSNPDGSDILMRSDSVDLREFPDLGIAVHGRSFQTRAVTENLAASYPSPIGGVCNIGLLHTSLTGAEGHDPYSPCTPVQLSDMGYDYWALGHIHARADHGLEGAAPIVFSGNIQGRHIRETGAKGCMIIDVDERHRCRPSFRELDEVRWELCELDVSAFQHRDEIFDAYQQWLTQVLPQVGDRLLVSRVRLTGPSELHVDLRRDQANLRASFQATASAFGNEQVWLEDVRVRCTEPSAASATIELDGPLESLASVIQNLRSDQDAATTIREELDDLFKKLPALGEDGEPLMDFTNSEWVDETIEAAASEVLGRLRTEEVSE